MYTLFSNANVIRSTQGMNLWLPYTVQEVGAKDNMAGHCMVDFMHGKCGTPQADNIKQTSKTTSSMERQRPPLATTHNADEGVGAPLGVGVPLGVMDASCGTTTSPNHRPTPTPSSESDNTANHQAVADREDEIVDARVIGDNFVKLVNNSCIHIWMSSTSIHNLAIP